jgi:hypothetical protein
VRQIFHTIGRISERKEKEKEEKKGKKKEGKKGGEKRKIIRFLERTENAEQGSKPPEIPLVLSSNHGAQHHDGIKNCI